MAKAKNIFLCQSCAYESPKWVGKCPSCGSWNTFVEEIITSNSLSANQPHMTCKTYRQKRLHEIEHLPQARIITLDKELNRTLGGGIVPGSMVLIGGEPGIGKSTLMLQAGIALTSYKTLYVSGEESEQQIKMHAERLIPDKNNENFYVLTETNIAKILHVAKSLSPQLIIIDSVQTLQSDTIDSVAGSVGQIRQCAVELTAFAKHNQVPVCMVGHINKEGALAGPKILEHMVDTVLIFEGNQHLAYRILRTIKNRFGPTSEIGIYEMVSTGLHAVSNPSHILMSARENPVSGSTVGATLEGNRPLMIEVQSLVSTASYSTPQRVPNGFDPKRLNLLLAVLEKRGGYHISIKDVFVNIAGGIKVEDPSIDLAVCMSLLSALEDTCVSAKICFAAEVGLGGEIRAIRQLDKRISEAEKLGFETMYISHYHRNIPTKKSPLVLKRCDTLGEVVRNIF